MYSNQLHLNHSQVHQPKTHSYCHVIACIILCIALIVFLFYLSVLFPLGRRCTDIVIVDTDEDSMLSSEVTGKQNPLVHSDTIPLSRSALFYCIRTTTIQLLHAAVVEPLILCMTYHRHSKQMKPTSMSRSCLSPDVPTHSCLFVMPATAQS